MIKGVTKEVLEELKKFSVGSKQWIAVLKSNSQSNLAEKKLDGLLAALIAAGYSLEVIQEILSSVILSQEYIDQLDALSASNIYTEEEVVEILAALTSVTGTYSGTESAFTASSVSQSTTVQEITGASELVGGALDLGNKTITVSVTSGSIDRFEGSLLNKAVGVPIVGNFIKIQGTTSTGVINNATVRSGTSSLTSFVVSREVDGVYIDGTKLIDNSELPEETIQINLMFASSTPFSISVTVTEE